MSTVKLFVGYRTRVVANVEALAPEPEAPSNYKDRDKIAAFVAEAKKTFFAEAKNQPYTGTFDEVFLVNPSKEGVFQWQFPPPDSKKPPIAVSVRNYLLKNYPDAWAGDIHDSVPPKVVFIGFDMRRFLKMLGLECSLPSVNKPLPPRLWYGNSDHRDIEEAVMPREFKHLSLKSVLAARRPAGAEAAERWDALVKDWPGPHVSPEKDVLLAVELAAQLGIISA